MPDAMDFFVKSTKNRAEREREGGFCKKRRLKLAARRKKNILEKSSMYAIYNVAFV